MKKHLMMLIISIVSGIASVCTGMYCICHFDKEGAIIAFLIFVVSAILGYVSYFVYDAIVDVKENYEYSSNEDEAAAYLSLQSDTRLELYFCSLAQDDLQAEQEKYSHRHHRLKTQSSMFSRTIREKQTADCIRFLDFINKALQQK